MYELLILWFFCIVYFSLANIALIKLSKPISKPMEADSDLTGIDWLKSLPNDAFIDLQDETDADIEDDSEVEADAVTETPVRIGKVTMLAENLAKALNTVKDSFGSNTLPILNKVLIEFKNGMATFTTTNLETATVTSCGCKIENEFSCLLPFKLLKDLSELLYDDIVTFEQSTASGSAYLSGRSYSNVPTILIKQRRQTATLFDDDIQDYPPMPKVEGQSVVIMDLTDAIKQVKDKMITQDKGWKDFGVCHFAGLYFDLSKPQIVATDGNRMKIATLNCEPKPIQFRIDKDCALTLAKFKDMECMVTSNEKGTRFDFGFYMQGEYPGIKTTILTQNLQGKYPDYEALKETHKELVSIVS